MADWISLLGAAPNPAETANDLVGSFDNARKSAIQIDALRREQAEKQRRLAEQQEYRSRVSEMLRGGDYNGAAAQAALIGDDKAATNFIAIQKNGYDQQSAGAGALGEISRGIASLPYEQRRNALVSAKPALIAMGYKPEEIDAFDPTDANIAAVAGLGYSAHDRASDTTNAYDATTKRYDADTKRIEANNPVVVGGSLVTRGGQEIYRAPDYISAPMSNNVIEVPGTSSNGYSAATRGPVSAESLYRTAIKPQESGGQPNGGAGAVGPQTPYGRALGSSQMLPGTAAAMAKKLGVPWRPDLMSAKTPEGLAYQDRLGIAYTQEALDATGGDPRRAAEYYHGGPNTNLHGPRTRRYAQEVMQRYDRSLGQRQTTRNTRVIQQGVDTVAQRQQVAKPLSEKDMAAARTKLAQARRLKDQVMQMQQLDPEGGRLSGATPDGKHSGIYGGIVGGRVSGSLAGGDTDRFDTLVSNVRNTITSFTRVPGIGAQSDYEARLAAATMPDRTRSAAGRAQAYREIWQIATDMERELTAQSEGRFGDQPVAQSGGSIRVPKSHIDALRAGRVTPQQFDSKYGVGASNRALSTHRTPA